jgi:hypothetical protein
MSAYGIAIASAARAVLRRLHVGHGPDPKRRRLAEDAARRREAGARSRAFGRKH